MADLKVQIIEAINLKHLKPEDIGDEQPLFVEGLGLDSIDALELIDLQYSCEYGVCLAADLDLVFPLSIILNVVWFQAFKLIRFPKYLNSL